MTWRQRNKKGFKIIQVKDQFEVVRDSLEIGTIDVNKEDSRLSHTDVRLSVLPTLVCFDEKKTIRYRVKGWKIKGNYSNALKNPKLGRVDNLVSLKIAQAQKMSSSNSVVSVGAFFKTRFISTHARGPGAFFFTNGLLRFKMPHGKISHSFRRRDNKGARLSFFDNWGREAMLNARLWAASFTCYVISVPHHISLVVLR